MELLRGSASVGHPLDVRLMDQMVVAEEDDALFVKP